MSVNYLTPEEREYIELLRMNTAQDNALQSFGEIRQLLAIIDRLTAHPAPDLSRWQMNLLRAHVVIYAALPPEHKLAADDLVQIGYMAHDGAFLRLTAVGHWLLARPRDIERFLCDHAHEHEAINRLWGITA